MVSGHEINTLKMSKSWSTDFAAIGTIRPITYQKDPEFTFWGFHCSVRFSRGGLQTLQCKV